MQRQTMTIGTWTTTTVPQYNSLNDIRLNKEALRKEA